MSTPIQHTQSAFPSIVELVSSAVQSVSILALQIHAFVHRHHIFNHISLGPTSHLQSHDIPPLRIQLFRFSSQFTSPRQGRRLLDIYYTSQSASSSSPSSRSRSPTSTTSGSTSVASGVLTSVTVIGRHLDDCVRDRRRRMSSKSKSKSFPLRCSSSLSFFVFVLRLRRFDFFPFLEVFVKVCVLGCAKPKADVSEP